MARNLSPKNKMKTIRLEPQTKLLSLQHVMIQLRSAPSPASTIELAKGEGYSLQAFLNARKGLAVSLSHNRVSWALSGYTATELRGETGETLIATVILNAEEYIAKYSPANSVAKLEAEINKPWSQKERVELTKAIDILAGLFPRMRPEELMAFLGRYRNTKVEGGVVPNDETAATAAH